jgi:hypothetical protein
VSDGSAVQVRTLNVLDSAGASEWNALVRAHPDSTAFHEAGWAVVIHETYGHQPLYLCFADANDVVALVPLIEILSPITGRRAVCVPFSDACGPLLFRDGSVGVIKDGLIRFGRQRGWKYCEIRGGELSGAAAEPALTFYGHTLRLSAEADAVFAGFASGAKRAIRQAIRNGVNAEISRDRVAVQEFYKLHVQTRKRHGVPPQPLAFFANVHMTMIESGLGFTVLARSKGRTVAGAIFFRNAKRALYKFAASDIEFTNSRGNNLVLWTAIQYLIGQGCEELHFGRTSPDNDGLRRFKLSWGAEETMIQYTQLDVKQERWAPAIRRERQGLQNRIFRGLPSAVNRLAGTILYSHLD